MSGSSEKTLSLTSSPSESRNEFYMNWIFVIGHSFKAVEGYPLPQAIFSFNIYVEGQPKKKYIQC